MPGEINTKGAQYALDSVTGRAAGPASRTTYLALLSAAPNDASALADLSELATSTGYARQSVTWSAPTGDPTVTSNTATVTFGPFTSAPANATHAALVSVASGTTGEITAIWQLTASKQGATGDTIQFTAGQISISLD